MVLEGDAVGPTRYVLPLAEHEAMMVRWVGVTLGNKEGQYAWDCRRNSGLRELR